MLKRTIGLIAVAVMLGLLVLIVWLRGPWVPSAFAPSIHGTAPTSCIQLTQVPPMYPAVVASRICQTPTPAGAVLGLCLTATAMARADLVQSCLERTGSGNPCDPCR